jgi:hypothetical protein
MIRELTANDLDAVSKDITDYIARAPFFDKFFSKHGYVFDPVDIKKWLVWKLVDCTYKCLVVEDEEGKIVAGCGANLITQNLPPHLVCIQEWAWWGEDKRAAVSR